MGIMTKYAQLRLRVSRTGVQGNPVAQKILLELMTPVSVEVNP